MPYWEFECPRCFHRVTKSFPRFKDITLVLCDRCNVPPFEHPMEMERLPSAPGVFVLKGAGFHKNDYPSTK